MVFRFSRAYIRFAVCISLLACLLALISFPQAAHSEDKNSVTFDTARFTLHFESTERNQQIGGLSRENIAKISLDTLNSTAEELSRIFQAKPHKKVVLRFLSPKEFRRQTGAPSWTSAMYFRDEITIPLSNREGVDVTELRRALRHEYVHAFIAELSDYNCPAWLDEGIAQLLEGQPNPLLGPALRKWVNNNSAIPLSMLKNGFTTMSKAYVPAAYAQSLFATRKIVHRLGFSSITLYLKQLGAKASENAAFVKAFGQKKAEFENELTREMRLWAKSNQLHP